MKSNKLNRRWSCKLTMKFVRLYLKQECLWNPKHLNYKENLSKQQAYQDIVNYMKHYVDIDINGVRNKIRNLRGTYLQEVNKIIKRSTDPDNVYEPSLPWFREMDKYLKDVIMSNVDRPESKWAKQCEETYPEEHLDEDMLEGGIEAGEVTEKNHSDDDDSDSDISDFIYRDAFGTRWSGDVTLKFVKYYLKHECLWNPKHSLYTNKKKKSLAFQDIIHSMNKYVKLDINGVRYKIRNLRSTYNQEILKVLRKSKDPNNIYIPNMPWFKLMDEKLKDVVQLKSRLIKAEMTGNPSWKKDAMNKNIMDDELLKNIKQDVDFLDDDNLNQDDDEIIQHNNVDDDEKEIVNSLFIPSHTNNAKDIFYEDEYDIFGKYIAAQLRKLELKRSLHAKADILNILTKARLDT